MSWNEEYRNADAFWQAAKTRAKVVARAEGSRPEQLLGRAVMQTFLARVFSTGQSDWVVAGGTGMLLRIPGARTTDDVDVVTRRPLTEEELLAELEGYAGENTNDPFTFQIGRVRAFSGENPGAKVRVTALINGRRAHAFDLDIASKPMIGAVELHTTSTPIDGLRGIPTTTVPVYPVAAQAADKLAAMYRHLRADNPGLSTRYHDLADLVFLARNTTVDAADLTAAITRIRGAGVPLPRTIEDPGGDWARRYPDEAAGTALPRELHSLSAALDAAGAWLNPTLGDSPGDGKAWHPGAQAWVTASAADLAADAGVVYVTEHTRGGVHDIPAHTRRKPVRRRPSS